MKWFVYTNQTYYPYAMIVEAETADQAIEEAREESMSTDLPEGTAVFPVDALALWKGDRSITETLDEATWL